MTLRNTPEQFGTVHRTLHWIIALLIVGLICIGLYMVSIKPPTQSMFRLFALHKSLGIIVLALALLRVSWRFFDGVPFSFPNHKAWEKGLAHLVHFLLYFSMFAMPLSGWLMSSAKGFSVSVFGVFTLPDLIKPNESLAHGLVLFHIYTAYTLIGLIGLHVAGALKHALIDHDGTLSRMLPFGRAKSV